MNRPLKILTFVFALVFLALLALNVKSALIDPFGRDSRAAGAVRSYHFAFFLPQADYSFFRELKAGALDAAKTMDSSISFHPIDTDPASLEMARYSGFDGVAAYPYRKDDALLASLAKIYDADIPIVQIENQALNRPKSVFIGTNSYDFGKALGRLALRSESESLRIALVYSEKNPGLMADGNLLEMGMKSVLERRLSVLHTARTSLNPLDAERLTNELIGGGDRYDLIVFTDTNDTLVAVQAIIDMNRVGSVQIIGFGDDPAIAGYVDKGVVLGSIVRDPYEIGFNAVVALAKLKKNGYTSAYVDTAISVIVGEGAGSPGAAGAK